MFNLFKKLFERNHKCPAWARGKHILVIDDGEVERRFMTEVLTNAGYRVTARPEGISGLETALRENPDLIILDYLMPEMDGNEVCKKIKSNSEIKTIPVIFLTGSSRPETVITCYDVGADQYLNKPISAGALLQQVQATLEGSQAQEKPVAKMA